MLDERGSPAPRRALFTPVVDALCTGGLSLVAIWLVVSFGPRPLKGHDYGTLFVLGLLLNWPHFIASYRLLYATGESIRRYRAASTWVPAALFLWCLVALLTAADHPAVTNSLLVVSSVYLARHYTGQTWGMMASFSHLEGMPFSTGERRLVRWSLDLLMVWHGLFAAVQTFGLVSIDAARWLARIYPHATVLRIAALVVGGVGLVGYARRHRRLPPVRVLLPWAAVNVWYVALAEDTTALLAIQLGHALQYLVFPVRIEVNRAHRRGQGAMATGRDWPIALASYAAWTVVGIAVFEGMEPLFRLCFQVGGGDGPMPGVAASAFISAIGIHHYYIDGALYKLRNPEVRRDLFAHEAAPAAAPPAAAQA
jgi:hypothetical protein